MTEIILSVYFINENNLKELETIYKKDILSSMPGTPAVFAVGKRIVIQTIHTDDLFDPSFKCTRDNVWLCTDQEFNERFDIVEDENMTETFALIALKK